MTGFVSFVGSGPGDPELLTLKAVDRLKRADAVLFDDLSAGPILEHARKGADLVGVGKRAGPALAAPAACQPPAGGLCLTGARVVRLKSGDPGLFGRLEEELTALREAGIDLRDHPRRAVRLRGGGGGGDSADPAADARRVQFITGHDVRGALPPDMRPCGTGGPRGDDAVFMGKRTFPGAGRADQAPGCRRTPALLAENVSAAPTSADGAARWPNCRTVTR